LPAVIGYGEDFLTLWALTEHLDLVLKELEDNTVPSDCLVIYRPSFGRAGASRKKPSAQFGEFDAIIVTSRIAYLVESKWDRSNTPNNVLKLDEVQLRRHNVIKWYHDNWDRQDWDKFLENNADKFRNIFEEYSMRISPKGSLLSQNLRTVLEAIQGRELRNVLLFFHRGEPPQIETSFKVVKIRYTPKLGNYIELQLRT
jgi:hypothetical protein